MENNIASVEYSEDLDGFIVELKDGRTVQVQFEQETSRLHANYGDVYPVIDEDNEYGLDLSEEEKQEFIKWMNSCDKIQDHVNQ